MSVMNPAENSNLCVCVCKQDRQSERERDTGRCWTGVELCLASTLSQTYTTDVPLGKIQMCI